MNPDTRRTVPLLILATVTGVLAVIVAVGGIIILNLVGDL